MRSSHFRDFRCKPHLNASGKYRGKGLGFVPASVYAFAIEGDGLSTRLLGESMNDESTALDQAELEENLRRRADELDRLISRILANPGQQNYAELEEGVGDRADASTADQLADLTLADIDRHTQELDAIRQALQRIREGRYGLCIDCGTTIPAARLQANPLALRCLVCQEKWEHEQNVQSPRL
jgi:RNA polymerase-binding protein DksA